MKKNVFSLFAGLVLLWSCSFVFAQSEDSNAGAENKRAKKLREIAARTRSADANAPPRRAEVIQTAERERQRELARQQREKRMKEMMKEREKSIEKLGNRNEAGGPLQKGMDRQQQLSSFQQQISQEEQKHLERMAKLNRIRELAEKKDAKESIARVGKLVQKEQMRYERKREQMQRRMSMLQRLETRKSGGPDEKKLSEETRKAMEKYKTYKKSKYAPKGDEKKPVEETNK
ncbi:MAG TPA: hypothetical protein VMX13_15410 [Sedimentisphaerales bacterium]|nr:hypothetical protein [Sedimentisphaerales bacterium]